MRGLVVSALLGVCAAVAMAQAKVPDFGPNVEIFSPKSDAAEMQKKIDAVYATQQHSEFGVQRNAFVFFAGRVSRRCS